MILARRVGAVILAVAAALVWFTMAPEDRSDDISQALVEYELNEARTEGAPQQQVVNGWVAKDLLTIIAEQQNDAADDERIPALAALAVLGVALFTFTASRTPQPSTAAPKAGTWSEPASSSEPQRPAGAGNEWPAR
jgi:Flp pilus assembly protein TadB